MSRKVTMNDLFADPTDDDGGSSSSKAATLNNKFAHGTPTKSQVTIQKTATQGEFGAKKFIKP
jgi:hypothetical protein